jgi:hypothetical protein
MNTVWVNAVSLREITNNILHKKSSLIRAMRRTADKDRYGNIYLITDSSVIEILWPIKNQVIANRLLDSSIFKQQRLFQSRVETSWTTQHLQDSFKNGSSSILLVWFLFSIFAIVGQLFGRS